MPTPLIWANVFAATAAFTFLIGGKAAALYAALCVVIHCTRAIVERLDRRAF